MIYMLFSILCFDLAAKENSDFFFYCNRIRIPDSRDWLVVVLVTVSFGSFGLILPEKTEAMDDPEVREKEYQEMFRQVKCKIDDKFK